MSTNIKSPELQEVIGKLDAKRAELAAIFAEAGPELDMTKVKSLGDTADVVAHVRKLNEEMGDLGKKQTELSDLLAIARTVTGDDGRKSKVETGDDRKSDDEPMSFGDAFLSTPARTQKGQQFEVKGFDLKAVMTTAAGWAPQAVRNPRMVTAAERPVELLDFIPTAQTNQSAIVFMQEQDITNAAVEVAEGAAKPEQTLTLAEVTVAIRKIAVYLTVTDEQLDDVDGVRAYLNQRMGFLVRQRLAGQIVSGDGTAPNISGVLDQVGIQTQAKGADPTPDAVYKAMTKIRVTGQAEPDAVIFHPNDWQDVRLLRTVDGIYIWGNPSEAGPERIWGLQVIQAQAMTENTAVVGAWREFSTLFYKQGLTVDVGYNGTDWTENQQTIRAEVRAAPVFWRAAAFCSVTGI